MEARAPQPKSRLQRIKANFPGYLDRSENESRLSASSVPGVEELGEALQILEARKERLLSLNAGIEDPLCLAILAETQKMADRLVGSQQLAVDDSEMYSRISTAKRELRLSFEEFQHTLMQMRKRKPPSDELHKRRPFRVTDDHISSSQKLRVNGLHDRVCSLLASGICQTTVFADEDEMWKTLGGNIIEKLGEGTFGVVHLVTTNRPAIPTLPKLSSESSERTYMYAFKEQKRAPAASSGKKEKHDRIRRHVQHLQELYVLWKLRAANKLLREDASQDPYSLHAHIPVPALQFVCEDTLSYGMTYHPGARSLTELTCLGRTLGPHALERIEWNRIRENPRVFTHLCLAIMTAISKLHENSIFHMDLCTENIIAFPLRHSDDPSSTSRIPTSSRGEGSASPHSTGNEVGSTELEPRLWGVEVIDFGTAVMLSGGGHHFRPTGSNDYPLSQMVYVPKGVGHRENCAPEIRNPRREVDQSVLKGFHGGTKVYVLADPRAADVYSIGVVLLTMIRGAATTSEHVAEFISHHQRRLQNRSFLHDANSSDSSQKGVLWSQLIAKMLHSEPTSRPTCTEVMVLIRDNFEKYESDVPLLQTSLRRRASAAATSYKYDLSDESE